MKNKEKKILDFVGEKEAATMIVFVCLCRELLLVGREIFVSLSFSREKKKTQRVCVLCLLLVTYVGEWREVIGWWMTLLCRFADVKCLKAKAVAAASDAI